MHEEAIAAFRREIAERLSCLSPGQFNDCIARDIVDLEGAISALCRENDRERMSRWQAEGNHLGHAQNSQGRFNAGT